MSTLNLRLPQSLYEQVRTLAEREGVSIHQFIAMAVAEKAEALMAENYLAERAKRGSREDLLAILEKVPDVEPDPHDKHRALRRHHYRRLKRKRRDYYGSYGRHRDDVQGTLANTATLCSCWMCGNPRKYFGEETRQEVLANLNFVEQAQQVY